MVEGAGALGPKPTEGPLTSSSDKWRHGNMETSSRTSPGLAGSTASPLSARPSPVALRYLPVSFWDATESDGLMVRWSDGLRLRLSSASASGAPQMIFPSYCRFRDRTPIQRSVEHSLNPSQVPCIQLADAAGARRASDELLSSHVRATAMCRKAWRVTSYIYTVPLMTLNTRHIGEWGHDICSTSHDAEYAAH